jgi:zinc finger MYND domain-containing protein 10
MAAINADSRRRKGMMNISDNTGESTNGADPLSSAFGTNDFLGAPIITASECERLVESLQPFPLEEVGSEKWLIQHEVLEKLNMQAHHCAKANSDDFVLEALVTFDKLPVIVHELVVIEAWRENVYPLIEKDVLRKGASMRAYFTLYHEATLANLLETIFYHDYAAESVGSTIIELIDWSSRRLIYLNALPENHSLPWAPEPKKKKERKKKNESKEGEEKKDKDYVDPEVRAEIKAMAESLDKRTPEEDLRQQYLSVQFRVATAAVTIMRYLCAQGSKLGVSVLTRLINTHDVLTLIIPLIDNPPWTRRIKSMGTWEKWQDQKWSTCKPADLLKLTKLEAQAWLTVYNLISDAQFRAKYHFNSYRKDALLRVRKYINDVMVDQLPVFADVQRFMDELAISSSQGGVDNGTALVMELMPEIRDAIMAKYGSTKGWAELALLQLQTVFCGGEMDSKDKGLAALADLYSGDALASLMAEQEMSPDDRRGRLISASIAAYCNGNELTSVNRYDYQVDQARPTPQSTSGGMFERYKLSRGSKNSGDSGRPVPSDGFLLIKLGFEDGSIVEARSNDLNLPGQQYTWSKAHSNSNVQLDAVSSTYTFFLAVLFFLTHLFFLLL